MQAVDKVGTTFEEKIREIYARYEKTKLDLLTKALEENATSETEIELLIGHVNSFIKELVELFKEYKYQVLKDQQRVYQDLIDTKDKQDKEIAELKRQVEYLRQTGG